MWSDETASVRSRSNTATGCGARWPATAAACRPTTCCCTLCSPEDICIRVTAFNRGPEAANLHIMPHLWFRNTWSWTDPRLSEPTIEVGPAHKQYVSLIADDSTGPPLRNLQFQYSLGRRYLYGDSEGQPLFTNNETICSRIHTCDERCPSQYVKDAFHRYIIHGEACVNPEQTGTKACIHYSYEVPASGSVVLRIRLVRISCLVL